MPIIVIKLPHDRDYCGELSLVDADGGVLAGPFEVAGRANTAASVQAGNPGRSPLLPYGDTPTGTYRLASILASGAGTVYPARVYGGHGVLVLNGIGGDAALAEANGRFHFFAHGGATHKDGRLCSTNGALRLRNADLAVLLAALKTVSDAVECWCVNDGAMPAKGTVYAGNKYHEGDPPIMRDAMRAAPQVDAQFSRRRMMQAGAALTSLQVTRVLLPGVFIGAEAVFAPSALAAYDNGTGNDNDNNGGGGGNNSNNNGLNNNNGYNNNNGNNNNGNNNNNNNGSGGTPPNAAY